MVDVKDSPQVLNSEIWSPASVLLLNPDQRIREETAEKLRSNGFDVVEASFPGQALAAMVLKNICIILTEISFPDIEGWKVIRALRKQNEKAIIIVYTSLAERRQGPDRRLGIIFEFIHYPVPTIELIGHVKHAAQVYVETKNDEAHIQKSKSQLEWLIWKEQTRVQEQIFIGSSMLANIKHSTSQGTGIGGLVTYIEMLEIVAKKDGNDTLIPENIYNSIIENGEGVERWLQGIENMKTALSAEFDREVLHDDEVVSAIQRSINSVEKLRAIKNQEIVFEVVQLPHPIIANRFIIEMAFREMLTNAFKYSPEGSTINITRYITGNSIALIILNDKIGEFNVSENNAFQSFHKESHTYDDRFLAEEFGMGIGLSMIHGLVSSVGGRVHVTEITDYATDLTARKRIVGELIFPFDIETDA